MFKYISILFLLSFSSLVAGEATYTDYYVPQNLHIYSTSGMAYVKLAAHDCSGHTYQLSPTHPGFEQIFSLLLAAQISGQQVRARFDGCASNGQGRIVGVYLK
jgi:hypothetical protein